LAPIPRSKEEEEVPILKEAGSALEDLKLGNLERQTEEVGDCDAFFDLGHWKYCKNFR